MEPTYKFVRGRVDRSPIMTLRGEINGMVEFESLPSRDLETALQIVDMLISSENDYWVNHEVPRTDPPEGSEFRDQ